MEVEEIQTETRSDQAENRRRIPEIVIELVTEQLGAKKEITPETYFIEDLSADSLDQVEIIMAAEDAFGIKIPEEAAEEIRTVGELIQFVRDHI